MQITNKEGRTYEYLRGYVKMPDGRNKVIYGKSQEELDAKIKEAQKMALVGGEEVYNIRVDDLSKIWYEQCKKPFLREKSLWAIRNALNTHILPAIGACRARDVRPKQLEDILRSLDDKSSSLQAKIRSSLYALFNYAYEHDIIDKNPVVSSVRIGGKRTEEKVPLTLAESRLLLDRVTNRRTRTFLIIGLQTGIRCGEILGLQWGDIDFKEDIIHVRHNAITSDRGETKVTEDLKTKAAKRDLPMPQELSDWLKKEKKISCSKYVLSQQSHKPMSRTSFRAMWRQVVRELPQKRVTAHILRHTYITRLFEAWLDIKEIQYLAGHSTPEMTMRIYTYYDRASRAPETFRLVRGAFLG